MNRTPLQYATFVCILPSLDSRFLAQLRPERCKPIPSLLLPLLTVPPQRYTQVHPQTLQDKSPWFAPAKRYSMTPGRPRCLHDEILPQLNSPAHGTRSRPDFFVCAMTEFRNYRQVLSARSGYLPRIASIRACAMTEARPRLSRRSKLFHPELCNLLGDNVWTTVRLSPDPWRQSLLLIFVGLSRAVYGITLDSTPT